MNSTDKERLYNQLPAIYRMRDKREGEPLRALLAVIETEFQAIEKDIDGLYKNWFIETCEDWVVPYIGDLLGVQNLHDIGSGFSQRAYVANTLAYRRRKGTPAVIEQLARDVTVTGWHARVVEFFNLLATTQNMNHLRYDVTTIDLHNAEGLELLGSPFERAAHIVDVRRIDRNGGRYNIPNIGIFLWRLQSYSIKRSTARNVGEGRYTFSPLGNDAPLFNQPQTEKDITHLAEEVNVPGMLRRRALSEDLKKYREAIKSGETKLDSRYFGDNPVFAIFLDGNDKPLGLEFLVICDLNNWIPPESQEFKRHDNTEYVTQVAVDPVLGRFVFLTKPQPTRVEVSYSYGFSGDIGEGPYERELMIAGQEKEYLFSWDEIPGNDSGRLIDFLKQNYGIDWVKTATIEKIDDGKTIRVSVEKNYLSLSLNNEKTKAILTIDDVRADEFIAKTMNGKLNIYEKVWKKNVSKQDKKSKLDEKGDYDSLSEALIDWADPEKGNKSNAIITITDNGTYEVNNNNIAINLLAGRFLVIQANSGNRPTLRIVKDGNVATLKISGGKGSNSRLILNGLLIEGGIDIDEKSLGQLEIVHCTLVPGWSLYKGRQPKPSITVADGNDSLKVEIDHSIAGPLCLPPEIKALSVLDSIIDPPDKEEYDISALEKKPDAISDGNGGAGPSTIIERTTVFGEVHVKELTSASNVIFNDKIKVERQQQNCVRYSFVPNGSQTPRRYRCQPDLEIAKKIEDEEKKAQAENKSLDKSRRDSIKTEVLSRLVPAFTSTRYGMPGYGQLHASCPEQIRTGAEDGSEMGAFYHLKQPQREANLRAALDEYLRFGLEPRIIYVD